MGCLSNLMAVYRGPPHSISMFIGELRLSLVETNIKTSRNIGVMRCEYWYGTC